MRAARVEDGEHHQRSSALSAEVARLNADTADRAERAAVMTDMESVSADRPD